MQIAILDLVDETQCYAVVRQWRWPQSVYCPYCQAPSVAHLGGHHQQAAWQQYACHECAREFDDLTGTLFETQPHLLKARVVGLYLRGLGLANSQIAAELNLGEDVVQTMLAQWPADGVTGTPPWPVRTPAETKPKTAQLPRTKPMKKVVVAREPTSPSLI